MSSELIELLKIVATGVVALVVRGIIAGIVSYFKSDSYKAKLLTKVARLLEKMGIDVPVEKILNESEDKKNEK